MSTVEFSIVVPCYNQAPYLKETLLSVKNQSYTDWECIVVNDGSTDDSEKIIDEICALDPRFRKITQTNQGLATTRNNGIRAAKGQFILPLDGDDKIGPEYLELAEKEFRNDPTIKLVYAEAKFFGTKDEHWPLPPYDYTRLLFVNCIYCSAIFRRDDYLKTEGYDTNMRHGYEDWEFWLQLLNKEDKVVRLDTVQFYYRQRAQSMISFLHEDEKRKEMETYIMNKHRDKYPAFVQDGSSMNTMLEISYRLEELAQIKDSLSYKKLYRLENSIKKKLGRK